MGREELGELIDQDRQEDQQAHDECGAGKDLPKTAEGELGLNGGDMLIETGHARLP